MRLGIRGGLALACCFLAPLQAAAQFQRCAADTLSPSQAELRVEWARRCALNKVSPAQGFNVGNAQQPLTEYVESSPSSNPSSVNSHVGNLMEMEINSTYAHLLYSGQPTGQQQDGYGFYKWTANAKRPAPYYPQYGSTGSSDSGVALFPHPTLADCNLYTDRSGYNIASNFYVNLYCINSATTPLTQGTPVAGLSGGAGSDKRFSVTVPEGSIGLYIALNGWSGNADLYVKRDGGASPSSYDCASTYSGSYEGCYFASPAPGTYQVLVKGVTDYDTTSLSAHWNELQKGSPIYNLFAGRAVEKHYSFYVPSGATRATFTLSGGQGDADLYVRQGAPPTETAYNCRPYAGGNNESCPFSYPSEGVYYVMVRGFSPFSGVTLNADYVTPPPPNYPCEQYPQAANPLRPVEPCPVMADSN